MTVKIMLAVAVVLSAGSAGAQSQTRMTASAARAGRLADQALNEHYRAAMARLSAPSRALLRDAQRSWIDFRDRHCRFEASAVEGGSAYPMVLARCVQRLSDERTRQLAFAARCQEGDLACPR